MAKNFFVTGGAGFIGSNYVSRLLERGEKVTIYDNLSRAGAQSNLTWLKEKYGETAFQLIIGDVRDAALLEISSRAADVIVHLAAQVAVTTSVIQPREDFEINAQGTFNMLEAARLNERKPVILYASTNKVYGRMEEVKVVEDATRWRYADLPLGCPETQPLDFHSPYGCSKGTGDQYVRDYARIYGLPTVVLRQSCIYGPRQFGVEDQGWVAWMIIAAITGRPLTIYGDGKQIRDVLHVDDLLNAYDAAIAQNRPGQRSGLQPGWRTGEHNVHLDRVSDRCWKNYLASPSQWHAATGVPVTRRSLWQTSARRERELGWKPKVGVEEGVGRLFEWVKENKDLF